MTTKLEGGGGRNSFYGLPYPVFTFSFSPYMSSFYTKKCSCIIYIVDFLSIFCLSLKSVLWFVLRLSLLTFFLFGFLAHVLLRSFGQLVLVLINLTSFLIFPRNPGVAKHHWVGNTNGNTASLSLSLSFYLALYVYFFISWFCHWLFPKSCLTLSISVSSLYRCLYLYIPYYQTLFPYILSIQ